MNEAHIRPAWFPYELAVKRGIVFTPHSNNFSISYPWNTSLNGIVPDVWALAVEFHAGTVGLLVAIWCTVWIRLARQFKDVFYKWQGFTREFFWIIPKSLTVEVITLYSDYEKHCQNQKYSQDGTHFVTNHVCLLDEMKCHWTHSTVLFESVAIENAERRVFCLKSRLGHESSTMYELLLFFTHLAKRRTLPKRNFRPKLY